MLLGQVVACFFQCFFLNNFCKLVFLKQSFAAFWKHCSFSLLSGNTAVCCSHNIISRGLFRISLSRFLHFLNLNYSNFYCRAEQQLHPSNHTLDKPLKQYLKQFFPNEYKASLREHKNSKRKAS